LFASGKVGMVTFGSWWLQESQLPPPVPPLVDDLKGFDFFLFPAIRPDTKPGAIVGGIDVGYGLTKRGAQNSAAWDFLASFLDGPAGTAALADINDLPAFIDVKAPSTLGPHVTALYQKFMQLLPQAINQRFYSATVQNALDNALAGVASGQLTSQAALASVQTAQDKALSG
jgi:raffinose/stachyose/melibiose transport system substrate-binding protein